MAGSQAAAGVGIVISAQDDASKTIARLQAQLNGLQDKVGGVGKKLDKSSKAVGGLRQAGTAMRELGQNAQSAFQSVGSLVPQLGLLTGAASVAGLYRLTTAFADFGSKLQFAAQRAGTTVSALSSLQGAARMAGSSAEALTSGMTTLNDNLTLAATGQNPEATKAFNYLGLSIRKANGELKNGTEILPEVADKIAAIKNPTIQAKVATMLLGGAAEDLLPFLRQGSAGFEEYRQKAIKYGAISEKGAAAANELRKKQTELTLAVEGTGYSIAEKLVPVLGPMLTSLTEWISNNRELIGTKVAEFVSEAVPWVISFAKGANDVAQALGGWKNVLLGIMGINLLSWAGRTIAGLTPLIRLLALIPGSGVTAAALAAAGLGYLGFQAARETGTRTAQAGEVGLRPASLPGSVDEFGNVMLYQDASGRTYTPDEARRLTQQRAAAGGGGAPAAGAQAPAVPDGTPRRISAAESSANFQTARDNLLARGWQPHQVAGILGNLHPESGLNPTAFNPAGGGQGAMGIAQWRAERIDRFRQRYGHSPMQGTLQEQLDYLHWELTEGPEREAGNRLRASRTAREAGFNFQQYYERGGSTAVSAARGQIAESYMPRVAGGPTAPAAQVAQAQLPAPVAQTATEAAIARLRAAQAPAQAVQPRASGVVAQVGNGSGASAASQETTVRGSADVRISLQNFPRGTRTAATTRGDLFANGAPRIEQAMPLGQG